MLKRLNNVEVIAIAEADRNLVDEVGRQFQIKTVYYDPEELIKDSAV